MRQAVMIDGVLRDEQQRSVSVFDRGFLFGDSVFETIRTYQGRPFALQDHLERLQESAQKVYITLPVELTTLAREVRETVRAAGNAESYVRVVVTRGSGPIALPPSSDMHPLRVIIVNPLQSPPASAYESGISVITYETQRVGDATRAEGAKVGNYLVAVLAMRRAAEVGAAEALITDHTGRVVEGATSNVFCVAEGSLVTPPTSAGILPGITRSRVLAAASELGYEVRFQAFDRETLAAAQELFISSSIRELLPVRAMDGQLVGDGRPGPVYRALLKRFRDNVSREMAQEP